MKGKSDNALMTAMSSMSKRTGDKKRLGSPKREI